VIDPGELETGGEPLRWLYHAVPRERWERAPAGEPYAPAHAHGDGAAFIHASYRDVVLESARLYLPAGSARVVLRIDPRRLVSQVRVARTPRGPMPHIHGSVPRDAIAHVYEEDALAREIAGAPDVIV
jgi:uncharacterized protein (DUF952 family)